MKAKCLAVAVLCGLCSLNVVAQEKKSFTLEDLNFGGTNYRNMQPKNLFLTWWGDQLIQTDVEECYTIFCSSHISSRRPAEETYSTLEKSITICETPSSCG